MEFGDESFVVDRTDKSLRDAAPPSRSTRYQFSKRPTEDSMFNDKRPHHRRTGDFEPRRPLRYTIPLRRTSKYPRDEETGYSEKKPYGSRHPTPFGIDREISRGSAPFPAQELLEIISTKWVPDDEGRELVTLTVKDAEGNQDQENIRCESRWKHIQSDAMTFKQLDAEVMRTPGLGDDDVALVARLLNKVRNTCEKKFVHGRYLKPITLVYEGRDPDVSAYHSPEERHARKTATFVSLPIFTIDCPQRHTLTKDFEGHPVRALLQSRYRLESTKRRDKEQVITKTVSIKEHLAHQDHVIHVPHLWALIINNYTIITCAALDVSKLRGDTIKLISYTAAQRDEATWSVHFTDARGNDFYLPLQYCKTWFDLVRRITDRCLNDEYSFIRDQILKGGPVYQLILASDESAVNAERWAKLVEETKTEVIHLKLVDKESVFNGLLVTYCDDEGNEVLIDSDDSSDNSPIFSSDDGEDSDASESSLSSDMSSHSVARAIDRLRALQAKLREAEDKGNAEKVENFKEHKIPALEEKLLQLTAAGLHLDTSTEEYDRRGPRVTIREPYEHWPRSDLEANHNPPLSPTERKQARLRSSSRSSSRPRLTKRGNTFSSSVYDSPFERPPARRHATQDLIIHDSNHSGFHSRDFRDIDYNSSPRAGPRRRSHMPSSHSLSRTSTLPTHSRSGWDVVRSRLRDRQLPGLRNRPISPRTSKTDIYYRPSEKQLARSYWDLVRSSVLDGGIHKLRDAENAKKDEGVTSPTEISAAITVDKQANDLTNPDSLSDALDVSPKSSSTALATTLDPPTSFGAPKAPHLPPNDVPGRSQSDHDPIKPKKVLFPKPDLKSKPKLKRLIKLAQKESPLLPKVATSAAGPELSSPVSVGATTDLPIFLWSTEHQQFESDRLTQRPPKSPNADEARTFKSFLRKPAEEIKKAIRTSRPEELILHALLAEIHAALKKPKKMSPEYAVLYEKTAEKSYTDIASSMNAIRNAKTGAAASPVQEWNVNKAVNNLRRASLALAGGPIRRTDSNRLVASTSGQEDLATIRLGIFDLASKILFAFVPKGYDAHVISKYWGALHKMLKKAGFLGSVS